MRGSAGGEPVRCPPRGLCARRRRSYRRPWRPRPRTFRRGYPVLDGSLSALSGRGAAGPGGPQVSRPGRAGPQASGAAAQVLGRTDHHRFDNLGHCLIVDHGWTDLADYSLNWRGRHPELTLVRLAQECAQ